MFEIQISILNYLLSILLFFFKQVYLLKGNDCPFLLRDLLASDQLADVFGQAVVSA